MTARQLLTLWVGVLPLVVGSALNAQHDEMPSPKFLKAVLAEYAENLVTYKDDKGVLVLPGVVAKRETMQVEVAVESTGVGSAVEFFVIGPQSSHGYEALLWSLAKPSDIHKGLRFLKISQGASIDPRQLRFAAKGERVVASIVQKESDEAIRLEDIFIDERTEKTLPHEGFIFTGSLDVPDPLNATGTVYVADAYDPYSVIPVFNAPFSVMDVVWELNQGEVYENLESNREYVFRSNERMTLLLEPEKTEGRGVLRDWVLEVVAPESFRLREAQGEKTLVDKVKLDRVIDVLRAAIEKNETPYLTLMFDGALTLEAVRPVCAVIGVLDARSPVRIEPPAVDQVYYKAFLPDPNGRDKDNRPSQPWELHLSKGKKGVAGHMVRYVPEWKTDSLTPSYVKVEGDVADGEGLRLHLDKAAAAAQAAQKHGAPAALLVFASKDLLYSELMSFLTPVLSTHKTVHVFFDEDVEEADVETEAEDVKEDDVKEGDDESGVGDIEL